MRQDVILHLVKNGSIHNPSFRKGVEALIVDERAKGHGALAAKLEKLLTAQPQSHTQLGGNLYAEIVPQRSLSDLILPGHVSELCRTIVLEQEKAAELLAHNLHPRNRILLIGPPGNGKTSLAEALASALDVPFLMVRYTGVVSSYLGETASKLQKLFDYAASKRCVLFLDEFETLGKERGDTREVGEIKRLVSTLLMQIDSLPSHVVLVAATNHPELLDRAAWRRFQVRVELPMPEEKEICDFLRKYEERNGISFGFRHDDLARDLKGRCFSEIEDFIVSAHRDYVLGQPEADIRKILELQFSLLPLCAANYTQAQQFVR
jgi:SpoVK/Ycf46/Vps4 family AAA+-type ATPase